MSGPNQEQPNSSLGSSNANRANLTLDFSRPHQRNYERMAGDRNREQSGFVSSSTWTTGDDRWYKAQSSDASSNVVNRPIQVSKVTNSQSDIVENQLRILFG